MTKRRTVGLGLLMGVALLLGVTTADTLTHPRPLVEPLGVLPPGTPTPANWRAGLVIVRDAANYGASTPRPGQIGTHIELRPTVIAPNGTPTWNAIETKVAQAAGRGLKVWLSTNLLANGTKGTPDPLYVANGWPTVVYDDGCGNVEQAPDYRALATPYARWVDQVVAKWDSNPNVAGYVFGAGVDEEAINVAQRVNDCATKRSRFEQIVTCEQFIAWARAGGQIWAERTDKPVTLAAGAAACVGEYAAKIETSNQKIFTHFYPSTPAPGAAPGVGVTPTPIYGVQYRTNGYRMDGGDEWNWSGGWGKLQTGQRLAEIAGAAYEFGVLGYARPDGCKDGFPCAVPTADRVGFASDAAYKSMSNGAANLFWQCDASYGCWPDYLSADARYVMTRTMGLDWTNSPAAWVRFADAVIPRSNYRSDQPGPWGFLATARGTQPRRYCSPSVYATSVAAGVSSYPTPAVCEVELSSPSAPESRFSLRYEPLTTVGVDVDDRWVGRSGAFRASVIYLDSGTDTFTVAWKNGSTEATRTVTKTNSGTWKKEQWTFAATLNDSYGEHDVEVRTNGGAEWLYLILLENTGTLSSPTAAPTWTPGPTPTVTPGATSTPAPAAVASAAEIGRAESVTLYASAPSTTHAGAEHEYLIWNAGPQSTALLRWPELSLPANSWVVSATVTLRVGGGSASGRLREVARPVAVAGATWNSSGVEPWAGGGGLGAADTRTAGVLTFPVSADWQTVTLRVDEAVRRWLEQGQGNYGWLIDLTGGSGYVQAEVAGAGHPLVDYRPQLTVWLAWSSSPTATPTPTPTPTLIATGTVAPTPTGTPTATATPRAGLWLSEVCPNPSVDLNLDGRVDAGDRAVELLNWQAGEVPLAGWRLVIGVPGATYSCAATSPQWSFALPRLASVGPWGAKVIYGRDLRNLMAQPFDLPSGAVMVLLCDPSGKQVDGVRAPELGAGVCLARSGGAWGKVSGAGLGR